MPKQKAKEKNKEFQFLLEEARRLGALEARIISSNKVVVEDRVLLKCRTGCDSYGKKFVCPPYTPTPDEFRKMLKEYRKVLIVKFPADAEAEEDVGRSLQKNQNSPATPSDLRERTKKFWDAWGGDKRRILLAMLELEKAIQPGLYAGICVNSWRNLENKESKNVQKNTGFLNLA